MEKIVYCEFEFLKEFLNSRPVANMDPEAINPVNSWNKLYCFIRKSKTYLNVPKDVFFKAALDNKLLLSFAKDSTLIFEPDKFPDIRNLDESTLNNDILHSVFLTKMNKIERHNKAQELGIIVLGIQDVNKFESLFSEVEIAIKKGESISWETLLNHKYIPISNSLVIVDNYILKDIANLRNLLDVILPQRLNIVFNLSIYALDKTIVKDTIYKRIIPEIESLREGKLNVKIVVCSTSTNDFHDRVIISNNTWIDCSGGFDLLKKDGASNKRTVLRIAFPFILNPASKKSWENESYIYLLEDLWYIEKPGRDHKLDFDYWGDKSRDNRLIKYYMGKNI